jgi:signal transduction histidine kinase
LNANYSGNYDSIISDINDITDVEIAVFNNQNLVASTIEGEVIDFNGAILVNERYRVWRIRIHDQAYYYTENILIADGYKVFIFRSESLTVNIPDSVYFTSLIGIIFFVMTVSMIIFFASQSFIKPINILRDYANSISPESPRKKIPVFSIREFKDLGKSLESTWERLNLYRDYQRDFLHNFSHEMKTPLTNIYGYAEGVYYGVLNENETKKGLEIILKESEKLKNSINQILLMGRIESDEHQLAYSKINLVDVIGDALNSVQIEAHNNNIFLEFEQDRELMILGDADKLEIALINIFSNGIRYAKTRITIKIIENQGYYDITIDDDGIGIPLEDRNKIFERFFIGTMGNTGLGLTIAKTIINRHNGSIVVDESPTSGARFIVSFPTIK